MKIFYVPIEPYEERYTEQWYRWWKTAFEDLGVDYEYVEVTPLTNSIQTGSVLDAYGTNYYKAGQLQRLIMMLEVGKIKDGDVIFFADLWFPGIEALQYIRNVADRKFKIAGILHAGTWDPHDFTALTGMKPWARYIENGWLRFIDKVFVGSEYHKRLIVNSTTATDEQVVVTGLPFDFEEARKIGGFGVPKENIVVFPHRLDDEKEPWLFDEVAKALADTGWQFLKTKEVTKNKKEYYELLAKSKIAVSFAKQETFGYAMLEALALGCTPVVPNRLSYKEMAHYKHKFATTSGAVEIVRKLIQSYTPNTVLQETEDQYHPVYIVQRIMENL